MTRRTLWLPVALVLAVACSSVDKGKPVLVPAVPFLTKETGVITVPRSEFITTWAAAQVLYREQMKQIEGACLIGAWPKRACDRLPEVRDEARLMFLRVEARIKNPESTIDWDNVATLVGLLAKVVIP